VDIVVSKTRHLKSIINSYLSLCGSFKFASFGCVTVSFVVC